MTEYDKAVTCYCRKCKELSKHDTPNDQYVPQYCVECGSSLRVKDLRDYKNRVKYSTWKADINYSVGDSVKKGLLVFESIASNKNIIPVWPRPLGNPWRLKIL